MKDPTPPTIDRRGTALAHLGWISTTFMVLSVPLVAILRMSLPTAAILVPLFIITSAATCGILLWSNGGPHRRTRVESTAKTRELENTITELEHRIESLETISRYEIKVAGRNWREKTAPTKPQIAEGKASQEPVIN